MESFKLWLIVTCLIASRFIIVHGSSDDPEEFRKLTANARKKCIAETQTTIENVINTEYGHFPNDVRLKCYFKCVLENFNVMDNDGNIKFNVIKKLMPAAYKEIANEMIDSCTDVTGPDKCEKSFNLMKCMFDVNPIAFIAP